MKAVAVTAKKPEASDPVKTKLASEGPKKNSAVKKSLSKNVTAPPFKKSLGQSSAKTNSNSSGELSEADDGASEAKTKIFKATDTKKLKKAKKKKSADVKSANLITGISFLVVDIASMAATGLFAFWIYEQLAPFWK
jgi:hypothetical protein